MNARRRKWLIRLAALSVLMGAFFVGIGLGKIVTNIKIRKSYEYSEPYWRQEWAADIGEGEARDRRSRELAENMQYVSLNRVLHFSDGSAEAKAAIEVDKRSRFGCIVTIIRDATGEVLYRSGVIDPGHYIERIHLDSSLSKGYYPCTAVWSYFAEEDVYAGETAWKVVVIIGE